MPRDQVPSSLSCAQAQPTVTDDEPFGALVAAVAADDGGAVVLGGYVGRGVGGAFWVGER
jgi:hypothetical protein